MQLNYKLLAVACMMVTSAIAQAQIYQVTLSGANENPPITSNGSGSAIVSINTTSHELRVRTGFTGLTGTTTASHIHCCTAPTGNAGVFTATPSFPGFPTGVTSGTFDATFNTTLASTWNAGAINANGGTPAGAEAAFANGAAAGLAYLNIHTTNAPGGEIRGTLMPFSFVSAATPATVGAARALDSLGAGTGDVNDVLVTLAMFSGEEQRRALVSLLPVSGQVTSVLASNQLFADYDQIGNRMGGLRDSANTTGTGWWLKAGDHDAEHDLVGRSATADSDGWDVMGGVDFQAGPNTLLGAAIGFSEDDISYSGMLRGGNGTVEGWRVTAYGEHRMGNAFVDAMLTYAQLDIDSLRTTGALGNTDADQWGARWAGGWHLDLAQGVQFTPQLRLDWSRVDIDAYQEVANTSGMALSVRSQKEDRLRASLGGQLDFTLANTIKPYVRAFWGAELDDDDSVGSASFVAGGNAFVATDEGLEDSGYVVGVGVNVLSSDTFGAALSYDRVDGDTFESDFIQAKILFRF